MPRAKRIWYPGAVYHVMSRGNRRVPIFMDDYDHNTFLEYLYRIREKYPFKIHSICLMTNHFHMAVETIDDDLSKIMQRLLGVYAEEYNHRHNFTGHLFEGRYTACLIDNERYFLEVSRYIHLNPVKAQMVDNPLEYEYSSYAQFAYEMSEWQYRTTSKTFQLISQLVDTGRILEYFGNDSREQYRSFVEGNTSHADDEARIQKEMKENEMWLPLQSQC